MRYRILIGSTLPILFLACLSAPAQPTAEGETATKVAQAAAKPATPNLTVKPSAQVTAEEMEGLSFEGLTEAQKKQVVSLLNGNGCTCSCGMTLARCRRDDSTCGTSLRIAKQVIEQAKAGKTSDQILKTALKPPAPAPAAPAATKFIQFDVKPGNAPAVGPKNAKVKLLHFLDYQ